MKRLLLVALLVSSAYLLMGSTWIRSYSIDGVCPYEYNYHSIKAYNVIPAIGGGYLFQGFVEYFDYEFWVWAANVFWKVDENGEVIWRRSGLRWEPYIIVISNGVDGYYCISSISGYSWMEAYDDQMNYIGSYDFELINGIHPSINDAVITDDGLVFAGGIGSGAVILKTDFEFNLVWVGSLRF